MSKKYKPLSPSDTGQIIETVKLLLTKYQETEDLEYFISAQKTLCSLKVQRKPKNKETKSTKKTISLEDLAPIM
jgi:hypothetical protein